MPDWKKIKAEYIRGGTSYQKLCDKYSVSFSTLRKVAKKEKWTDLKAQMEQKRDMRIVESVAEKEANTVELIDKATDLLLEKTMEMMGYAEIMCNPANARQIALTLKDIRELKGYKSELDRQEQMARIEKLRKEAKEEEQTDKQIKVVIANEIEEYCE